MIEHFFQCPYCWEQISVLIDTSLPAQEYIEDCEICCNPIKLIVKCSNGGVMAFEAISIEQ
ncbi:Cysteine-rich CPXCG [Zhouia amylolytica]|uniref:Cysteine-rich CPXCG n=1 Tax=Zhouia amylolytica TaxID=376730 RepID=A0A1I6NZ69_9FLAO|nr:CPXCG motif-containing cysteine-rich protein [Zhouia amylolytica]MCQ0112898.1 CPXCG motif-containing cysteine-rich protein [Zhouia amylolytica]SFS33140.1 Cysteine-rich CPXCG [Zhouia amylolytica]